MKNIKKKIKAVIDRLTELDISRISPIELSAEDIYLIVENDRRQSGRVVGSENIARELSNKLKNSRDEIQTWKDATSRESKLSSNYVSVIDGLVKDLDKKSIALEVSNKFMNQQERRLSGSSKRNAQLTRDLKSAKKQLKELNSELVDTEIDKEFDDGYEWQNKIAEGKYSGKRSYEQKKASDLYIKRIVDLFSLRDAKLIRNCLEYSVSDPAGFPGHNLMLIIANLARYSNLMPSDIEDSHSKDNQNKYN